MGKKKLKQEDLRKIHRFQSFSERIANIRINVAHRIEHVSDSTEEQSTFFGEGLAKWRELNCTTDFVTFSRETYSMVSTLPQLVHHKDEIVTKLKCCLQVKQTLAYEPLLDLLVQLARDLQAEFYPYFKDFFPILVSMTDTQDTNLIQCVFTSLAYLLKFLWRHMVKDIETVFAMYSELLGLSVKAHIRQFAVESFGFLLRKVGDHSTLFDIIFTHLSEQPDLTEGVGQLLFEMCRGVPKQFHSCTDSVLPLLLSKLGSACFSSEIVFQVLTKTVQLMAEHTRKEFAGPLWKSLLGHLSNVQSEARDEELAHTLHLVGILVSWRKGSRITDLSQLFEVLIDVLSEDLLSQQVLSVAVHLTASLILVTPHVLHAHTPLSGLVRGVCGVEVVERWRVELVVEFFEELVEKYSQFEEDIQSECLFYCTSVLSNGQHIDLILKFLAELCLHFEPPLYTLKDGYHSPSNFELNIDLSLGKTEGRDNVIGSFLADTLASWCSCFEGDGMEVDIVEEERVWAALVVLKHIRPCSEDALDHLLNIYSHLSKAALNGNQLAEVHWLVFSQTLSTLVRVLDGETLKEKIQLSSLLEVLKKQPSFLPLLSSVEEYLTALCNEEAPEALSTDWLTEFLPVLQGNLSSPHSIVRLVTLRILCTFEQLPLLMDMAQEIQTEDVPIVNVLEVCLKAEETGTDLETYRRRLLWLQKLKYSPHLSPLLPDLYREVPLRYLIGTLYVNFSLIWEPVMEIISSYAFEENTKQFWSLFGSFLEAASDVAEGCSGTVNYGSNSCVKWHSSLKSLFQYWNERMCGMECGRVDHANYRLLLWKCVDCINPNIAEARSRILVPLVLRFVKNEYSLQEDNFMETQDLRKASSDDPQSSDEGGGDVDSSRESKSNGSGHRKSSLKTLQAMLTVFTKFKNPVAFYRQDELKQLCMKLLTHKLSDVQKLSLACLLTYKPPYLLPYKENFERLLDDQSFREELISFSSSSTCCVVSTEHREQMVPILVRLLYGRMQRSSGGHESSKSGGRQGVVLRFLGSCEEREMAEFIKLTTLPFHNSKTLSSMDSNAVVDPVHVIPLKKQQGFLNLLGQMVSTIGPSISHYLDVLFPILLRLGASCTSLLDQRNIIQPHFVTALKALRQMILGRVSQCFDSFLDYDFKEYMERVYESLVWPQLSKLPQECVQSPTALLKLLCTWTSHQQYFTLLKTPVPGYTTQDSDTMANGASLTQATQILEFVYSCLLSPRVSSTVCDYIVQMTLNLLEEEGDCLGEELVMPHVVKLLEYLEKTIQENFKRNKQDSSLQKKFSLLSRISVFVKSASQSTVLLQLLLRFLKTPSKYRTFEEEILMATKRLVCFSGEISSYRPFSELFSSLTKRKSRALLCEIFMEVAKKDLDWRSTADIVSKLNAWDSKRIEEPDYDSRLSGFKEATEMLSSFDKAWSHEHLERTLPIIHNALFFLIETEDMSIRDGAASYVSNLIQHIDAQDEDTFTIVILGASLNTVKLGLRSKAEFARHEAISVLSQLVKTYSAHPKFSDLAVLSHHETEADFFENVKHIQQHRRTRAFRKLATVCSDGGISQTSYMWFLLPLANQVVFKPTTNSEQNLLGEAINVIGAISSHLNWTNYCFVLTHYLRQLTKQIEIQKSLVKVVVAVLDNFHFDLSSVTTPDTKGQDVVIVTETSTKSPPPSEQGRPAEDNTSKEQEEVMEEDTEDTPLISEDNEGEGDDPPVSKAIVKDKTSPKKILKAIMRSIIPSLQNALTKRIDVAGHKLSTTGQNEDSEILRVPIAIAMTKLLLALPEESLHSHLPSLLLKVCLTLKNRSRDVRDVGRSTLVKMAASLGPKYLRYIIKEMKDSLDRGYMLHVLSYCLHSLLRGMTPQLAPGDLDLCLELINSILIEDLFGVPAEERGSGENVAKIPESKTPQSFNCYEIMGTFLSPTLLPDLLEPVKQKLEDHSTVHAVHIVEEVFRRVGVGIHGNQAFTPEALLVFVHGLLSDSVPQLSTKPKPKAISREQTVGARPPDSRLLPPTPQRSGAKMAAVSSTGASVVSEFGLQLLYTALKRGKFNTSSEEQLGMLDPFVTLLLDSLSSRHVKVLSRALQGLIWLVRLPLSSLPTSVGELSSHLFELLRQYARAGAAVGVNRELVLSAFKVLSRALQGLVWLVRLPLPSLPTCIGELSSRLFELLRQYARAGAAVGVNRELVLSAFKAMTVIVRDYKHTVLEDELRLLLSFVEEDIHDYQRQSTAFPLLKAILARKLVVSEAYDVMLKVCQLSVTADSDHVRLQCRQAVLMFLMDYPLGKKLNRYLDFYISNLSYEGQSGRESVLEMLSSMFTKFPEKLIQRHSTYFFVPLSSQLINDESPTCRQMVGETVKLLLTRLDASRINDVISIINVWIESENLLHKRLGMQVLGLLIEVEGEKFEKCVSANLLLIIDCLDLYELNSAEDSSIKPLEITDRDSVAQGTQQDSEHNESEHEVEEEDTLLERDVDEMEVEGHATKGEEEPSSVELTGEAAMAALDHLLFTTLNTVHKLVTECSVLRVSKFASHINDMMDKVQPLLLHPHTWVRLASCRLYGLLFSSYTPDELVSVETVPQDTKRKKARRSKGQEVRPPEYMLEDTVLKVQKLSNAFCTQLWSPMLNEELASQAVKNLVFCAKVLHQFQLSGDGLSEDQENLPWLIGQLGKLARFEAGRHPKQSQKRICVLQWTAAVSVDLGREQLPTFLPSLLVPVYKELSDSSKRAGEELHSLAQEVVDLMKDVCGREAFSAAYAQVHQSVTVVRENRRKQAALEAVANPEKSIRRKRKKNELKKAAKKMKILRIRPDSTAAAQARRKSKHKH